MGMSSWIRGSLLGAGAFGQVYLAMDRVTGSLFAVKSTVVGSCNHHHHHQHKSDDDDGDVVEEEEKIVGGGGRGQKKNSTAHLAAMENEIRMLQGLESEFVVRCLGSSWSEVEEEEEKGRGKRRLRNVFLEYMPGGSLSDLLKQFFASGGVQQQQQPPLDELVIRSYTRSILQGIEYLHRRGIVHGDIKAKNVLVGSNAGTLKLADFGSAKRINAQELGLQEEQVGDSCMMMNGTPQWMAPEVVLQKEQGLESDIWSLGCTVVEMATGGRAPWAHIAAAADPFVALYCIGCTDEVPQTPASLSPQAHDFLAHCFQREPCKRWTAAQLLQHPFLKAPPPPPSALQSSNTHHQAPVPAAAASSSSPTSVLLDHATNTSSLLLSSVPPLCTPSFWKKLAALEFPRKTKPHEMEEAGGATGNNKNNNMWPLSPLAEGEWIVVRSPKAISIPNKQFPQAPHELAAAEEAPRTPPQEQEQEQEQEATSVAIAEESSPPPSSSAPNLKLEIIILNGGQELVQESVSISSTAECLLFSSECNSTQEEEEEEEEVAKSPAAELTTMESPPCRASSPTNCSFMPLPCRPPPGASLCTATRALGHKKLLTHNSGQCSNRSRTRFLQQQNLLLQMMKLDNSSSFANWRQVWSSVWCENSSSAANWRQFPSSSGRENSSCFAGNWRQVWSSGLDDDEGKSHRLGLLLLKTHHHHHHHHQRSKCWNVFEEENFTPPPPKTRIQINNQELVSLPWFSEYKKKKKKKKHLLGCCCSLVELPLCLHCTWHQWTKSKLLLHTITIHSITDFTCEIVGLCICVCSLLFLKNVRCLIDCKLL
jgi:serine/threonine protein kinase